MGDKSPISPQDKWMAHPAIGVQVSQSGAAPGQSSLVTDPDFERLVEAMEEDADEARDEWESILGNGVFTYLEASLLAGYKVDGVDCQTARDTFVVEWNKITGGGGNPVKLLAAYDMFSLKLGGLQRANDRLEALIAIDFAKLLGPLLAFVLRVKKIQLAQEFQRLLARLMKDLEEAQSAVTNAKIKVGLNIVVTAITTIVAPEATLAKILLAGGGMVAHIVIDRGLGEGSTTGTVVFVAGDGGEFVELSKHGQEAIEKLKGGSKTIGVVAGAVTTYLDVKEVYEGKEKVEKVKRDFDEVKKGYDELMAGVLPLLPDFIALDRLIKTMPALLNKALAAGNDAAKNYDAMKREIQRAIQETK